MYRKLIFYLLPYTIPFQVDYFNFIVDIIRLKNIFILLNFNNSRLHLKECVFALVKILFLLVFVERLIPIQRFLIIRLIKCHNWGFNI